MINDCEICGDERHGKEDDSNYHEVYCQYDAGQRSPRNLTEVMVDISKDLGNNVKRIEEDLEKLGDSPEDTETLIDIQRELEAGISELGYIPMFYGGMWFVYVYIVYSCKGFIYVKKC